MPMFIIAGRRAVAVSAMPPRLSQDAVVVQSIADLESDALSLERLVAVYAGLSKTKKPVEFKDRGAAVRSVWAALKKLPAPPRIVDPASKKASDKPKSSTHAGTKQERLIALLRQPKGATIETLAKASGWQAHSVRGVISGVIKKRLGLKVVSDKPANGPRIYRIA